MVMRNTLSLLGRSRLTRSRNNARNGSVAAEFAFIAPVLFMTIIGIVEVSMSMFTQHVIESATFNAARTSKTGYVAGGSNQAASIRAALEARLVDIIDFSEVIITSKAYKSFSAIGQPEPYVDANSNGRYDVGENYTDINGNSRFDTDRGTTGAGTTTDVVVYTVTYPWKIFTPLMGPIIGDSNGNLTMTSKIVVKNEPY
jgi:Flp pilus assembly protein TadG